MRRACGNGREAANNFRRYTVGVAVKDICRTTNGVNQSMSRQQQSQSNYEPAAAKTRGARVSAAGILNRRWAKATMRNVLCQLLI